MAKIRLLNLTTATDATVTSIPILVGAKNTMAERNKAIVMLQVTGDMGSANGDTVQIQIGVDSASGVYVAENLDPLSVLGHIDGSGEFASPGQVVLDGPPSFYCRAIFRPPSGTGTSSISLWALGAITTAEVSARTQVHGGP